MLPLETGEEHAVAATKTYVNSLGAVALLFAAMRLTSLWGLDLDSPVGLRKVTLTR